MPLRLRPSSNSGRITALIGTVVCCRNPASADNCVLATSLTTVVPFDCNVGGLSMLNSQPTDTVLGVTSWPRRSTNVDSWASVPLVSLSRSSIDSGYRPGSLSRNFVFNRVADCVGIGNTSAPLSSLAKPLTGNEMAAAETLGRWPPTIVATSPRLFTGG